MKKDGIYAPAQLLCDEPIIKRLKIGKCFKNCKKGCVKTCSGTPVAKKLQKKLLLFTTNQTSLIEINKQASALKKQLIILNEKKRDFKAKKFLFKKIIKKIQKENKRIISSKILFLVQN